MEKTVLRAYKMSLDPTPRQVEALQRYAADARWAYNWALRLYLKVDRYSYYQTKYYIAKAQDLGLDLKTASKAERKNFYTEYRAESKAYAKVKNEAYRARLTELLLNAAKWSTEDVTRIMRQSPYDLGKYWQKTRESQMPWWNTEETKVNLHVITTAFKNCAEARKRFFADPKTSGYPRFKKRSSKDSFTIFHDSKNPRIRPSARHSRRLIIPTLAPGVKSLAAERKQGYLEGMRVQDGGMMRKLRTSLKNGGKIKSVTISRSGNRWYASCLVEETITTPVKSTPTQRKNGSVGVDLGVKELAVLSDGTVVKNVRAGQKSSQRVAKLQKQMSRKVGVKQGETPSNRYKRLRARKAAAEHKAALQRQTATHQLSALLAKNYETIFIEDLNVKGMTAKVKPKPDEENPGTFLPNGRAAKSGLAKSILDVGFYEFKRQLEYKSEWYSASDVILISRFAPSSQRCSECGYVRTKDERLSLSDRAFTCPSCGHTQDRDLNAARNILQLGKDSIE